MLKGAASETLKLVRRLVIAITGLVVLLVGILMLVLPGPAFVVIPMGLAILSLEFAWAGLLLKRVRKQLSDVATRATGRRVDEHRQ